MTAPHRSIETRSDLESFARSLAEGLEGRLGALVCDADAGPDAETLLAIRPRERFASASLIKLLVLASLYRTYDGRLEELEQPRPIAPENRVGGDGLFHLLSEPTPTVEDLAAAMIAVSDNAATNELIDLLGVDRIAATAGAFGLEGTHLGRKMMHTPELDPSLSPLESDGDALVDSNGHRYVNTVTPRDCVALFADVHGRRSLSRAAYDRLERPLAAQNDRSLVPRYLPPGTPLRHKTGELPSVAADAGLLTVGETTVAYAFCCDGLECRGDGADATAELGAGVYRLLESRLKR